MSVFREHPDLLQPFRAGTRAALEAVYWEYIDLVAAVVRRGARQCFVDPAEQRDLIQETFAYAFEERARLAYDGLQEYRPYLLGICRNLMVNALRRRGREIPADLMGEEGQPRDEAKDSSDPWADEETMDVVRAYVQGLNPHLRRIYELRYVKGSSQLCAAQALGISRQKVRTLEGRLRQGLERALRLARRGRSASRTSLAR